MNRNVQRRRRTRPFLLLLAGLAVAAAVLVAATIGTAARAVAPVNTAPPTISGTAKVGSTLTANNGTWSGSPTTFTYQWRRCDKDGGSCSDISGAEEKTYELKSPDQGNTLRVRVNARNNDGLSAPEASVPTAVVGAAEPATPDTGCPNAPAGSTVKVADVKPPARLVVDKFVPSPSTIGGSFTSFRMRFHVSNTCNQTVSGAIIFAIGVPYNVITTPEQAPTGDDGWVEMTFNRDVGFPATRQQQLMVLFVRATKPGENVLTGISNRILISVPVNLSA